MTLGLTLAWCYSGIDGFRLGCAGTLTGTLERFGKWRERALLHGISLLKAVSLKDNKKVDSSLFY